MTSEKNGTSHYSTAAIIIIAVLFVLLSWLQWPLTASLILGATLFIQLMYILKKSKYFWMKAKEKDLSYNILQKLRPDISTLERNAETDIQ